MTVDLQSSMRPAIESGEKPPKITEWMAPMRAQARMAIGRLRNHRHVDGDAVAFLDAARFFSTLAKRQTSACSCL